MNNTLKHLREMRDKDRLLLQELKIQREKLVLQTNKELAKIDEVILKVTNTQKAWQELMEQVQGVRNES